MTPAEQAKQEFLGPGGFFEIISEEVLGQKYPVFKNRLKSLRELVENAYNFGDREFMVLNESRYSFSAFADLVAAKASALKEDFQIKKGDRIGIFAANSPEWAVTFFAAVSVGAIVSAYNGRWTKDEISYGLNHSSPRILFGDSKRLERLEGIQLPSDLEIVDLDRQFHNLTSRAPGAELPDDPINEDDPCLILYTSGTTGKPKGAVISHRGLIGFIQATMCGAAIRSRTAELKGEVLPERPEQNISLGTSPLFHVSGLHAILLISISTGGKIIYRPGRFDPEDILETIQKEGVTSFSALGSSGSQLASHPNLKDYDLSSVINIGFGGAPASPTIQQLMRDTFKNAAHAVGIGYGSSETTAVVASIGGAELASRPESCGQIAVGFEAEIRDDNGQALPAGKEGEIHCRSAYTMLGYWNDPEATKATIKKEGWLATGDIGHLDEEGFLYINSRARDMILCNAENIYPVEIEYRLDAHKAVAESAVIGVDHPEKGQEVMAILVPASSDTQIDIDEIKAFCAEALSAFKVPALWHIRSEPLPRNAAGKILKTQLETKPG